MLAVGASLAIALAVATVDQVTKRRLVARLPVGHSMALAGPARLRHVVNRRGGLVTLALPGAWALWATVTGVALWAASGPGTGPTVVAAVGLVVGGGAGNLVDRTARGGVVDFIALGSWPTFNLADVAIVVGAAVAGLAALGVG